jgi:hypothetical protein
MDRKDPAAFFGHCQLEQIYICHHDLGGHKDWDGIRVLLGSFLWPVQLCFRKRSIEQRVLSSRKEWKYWFPWIDWTGYFPQRSVCVTSLGLVAVLMLPTLKGAVYCFARVHALHWPGPGQGR